MFSQLFSGKLALAPLALGTSLALALVGCGSDEPAEGSAGSLVSQPLTQPFMMNGVPMTQAQAGVEYRYQPQASNPSGRVLSYNVVNKPDWAAFNESTGELSGTPSSSDVGTSGNIEIGVSDGTTSATVGPFRIHVSAGHTSAPTSTVAISGTPASSVSSGSLYRFLPTVAHSAGATLSFSILNRPTWALFNPATGLLVGTPKSDNVGTYANILISVSAGSAPVSLQAFTIRVQQPSGGDAPTLSGSPDTTVSAGALYSFTPEVSDPSGNALTYSILNLPSWAHFNAHTGELSGTAPATAETDANIVISVSDGTSSASLAPFSLSVEPSSGNGGGTNGAAIKFHPGMYVELDPGSGGGGLSGWLSSIASLKGSPGVVGVMLIQPWSALEFSEGVYSGGAGSGQGFDMVDQLLAACKAAGLQFILGYEDRAFGGPQNYSSPTSYGQLPDYFDTLENGSPGFLDAPSGTTFQGEGLQMIADVTNPMVTARAIALATAYGHRYDSNPNFEMFRTPETANSAFTGGGQYDQYVQQLISWMAGARAAFPHTGLSISANFLSSASQFNTLFNAAEHYAVGMGGPDTWPNFSTYAGTSNLVFNGDLGGTDYRGILPWVSEVQEPDENGNHGSPQDIYNFAMSGSLATGGSERPNYFIWSFGASWQGPNAFTNSQIVNFIASVNGAVNTAKPSTY
jgi:Putative Ig domain